MTAATQKALEALKQALIQDPELGIPDLPKPFSLFVAERQGVAMGILTQCLC